MGLRNAAPQIHTCHAAASGLSSINSSISDRRTA